ncbi:helix-turn-helix transcriptional regulator [Chitinimonas sp.]|uniref:helix-turn-helix transcriptional regulator n=1 Tax=Chitinimonas sp. TaxID=1934313 RepID=UPI0035B42899
MQATIRPNHSKAKAPTVAPPRAHSDSAPAPLSLLRLPEVLNRCGLSHSSVWRFIKAGTFPAPVVLGANSRAWVESEINGWIAERIAARGEQKCGVQ